jgi:hypothetical protein
MNILSMQTTIQLLYKTISGSKKKERFETILEPLQALIQIALLSYYPIGSKLTIQNNILHIQAPSYSQSMTRWYNNDTQEDLFYLFNIFCRFKKFYMDIKMEHTKLFELLISLAKNGINNLIRTYNQTDKTHVLHTLQMYKNMLDGTNQNYHHGQNHITTTTTPIYIPLDSVGSNSSNTRYNDKNNKMNKSNFHDKKNKITRFETDNNSVSSLSPEPENANANANAKDHKELTSNTFPTPSSTPSPEIDMDTIFIKISDLYSDEMFRIIYNTLIEIERDETNYLDCANGLNMILQPTNIRIKKWIDENIVF